MDNKTLVQSIFNDLQKNVQGNAHTHVQIQTIMAKWEQKIASEKPKKTKEVQQDG